MKKNNYIENQIKESSAIIDNLTGISSVIDKAATVISEAISNNKKIILFGNGGSAADAQHIAAELVGRYQLERKSYPAISLSNNSSIITAISNDYSFVDIFSRQCESLVEKGDVVIGISTSGRSENVKKALEISKKKGGFTIGLLGNKGSLIEKIVDLPVVVSSKSTPRIQECHRVIYHIICDIVEQKLTKLKI